MLRKYQSRTLTKNAFSTSGALIDIGFLARSLIIVSSSENTEDIQYSFNGTDVDGEIAVGEPLTLNGIEASRVWIKSASGGMEYRLWAWA